jgi:hypothetical protein
LIDVACVMKRSRFFPTAAAAAAARRRPPPPATTFDGAGSRAAMHHQGHTGEYNSALRCSTDSLLTLLPFFA